MKKIKGLSLLLALALLCQCLCFGVLATQTEETAPATEQETQTHTETVTGEEPTGETAGETTGETTDETAATEETEPPTEEPTVDPDAIPDVPEGAVVRVEYGCNTLDAALPLVRDEQILRSAKGVFVYDRSTETVLYGYNADQRLAPGGLVQILAALLVVENCNMNDVVTVSSRYINQLPLGVRHQSLKDGEQVTIRDLLHCLMLSSANDAAVVLAEQVSGSPEAFIQAMNDKALELGCTDTVVRHVSGLDTEGQYTTARDVARIIQAALEYEEFCEVFSTGSYTVPVTNKSDPRDLTTLNYFLEGASISRFYDERVTGGKASFTSSAAGATIAFTAQDKDLDLICVVIGAGRKYNSDKTIARYGNFEEGKDLMDYCFDGFRIGQMLYKGQSMMQLEVANGANDVVAVNESDMSIVLPKDVGIDDLKLVYEVNGGKLTAPLTKGQPIVSVRMWYRGSCVGETTLYAQTAVATQDDPGFTIQNGAVRSDEDMAQMLLYLGLVFLVIFVVVSLYLGINAARRAARLRRIRKMRRMRRDARMNSRRR